MGQSSLPAVELRPGTPPAAVRSAWYATDLGDYRPCRYTYQAYIYEEQAPLDDGDFTGRFEWFADHGSPDQDAINDLTLLNEQLSRVGLALPSDFVTFYTHSELRYALDEASVTGSWSNICRQPIPSPVEADAFMIRFFRDQQDCAIWYLYLRPGGETFVVFSHVDFEDSTPEEIAEWPAEDTEVRWCSPTFEQFAYRYWLENHIWRHLNDEPDEPLDDAMTSSLDHYREGQVSTGPDTDSAADREGLG